MKTKLILLLQVLVVLAFGSCVITNEMEIYPSKHSNQYTGESPLNVYPGYNIYNDVAFFIRNDSGANANNIMSRLYLEECEVILPKGRRINLLDNRDIEIGYSYPAPEKFKERPKKELLNVQPQIIEGKKVIPLEGINYGERGAIEFNEISSTAENFYGSANSFRLKYAFTVIWEDGIEEKHSGTFRFKREFRIWMWD